MYQPNFYKNLSPEAVAKQVKDEGFAPTIFENAPGFVYPKHKHPETKLLAFLQGV